MRACARGCARPPAAVTVPAAVEERARLADLVPERLRRVFPPAAAQFLRDLAAGGAPHELRTHEPARHARHLASIWGVPLGQVGRATLFYADGESVLVLVPADRKVGAPRLRDLTGAADLRVLRGDRGVGRVGWAGLDGDPGALPAVPVLYGARCLVERLVLEHGRLVIPLAPGQSVALAPSDYVRLTGARVGRVAGTTRLLPEGGMVDDPP